MSVETESRASRPGLSRLLKAGLLTAVGTIYTRLEIVSTEIEEERERLEEIVLLAIAGIFCFCMGVLVLSLLVAAIFWETEARLYVIGGMGILYLLVAGALGGILKSRIKHKPPMFAATLAELAKDRHALQDELRTNSNHS